MWVFQRRSSRANDVPSRLLRRLWRPRHDPRRTAAACARRPGAPCEPRQAVREVLDRLQRCPQGPRGAPHPPAPPERPEGRGTVRAGLVGRGGRRNRRQARRDRGRARFEDGPECALHRHVRSGGNGISATVLPSARRDRDRPRHDLQQGRARSAVLPLRFVGRRTSTPKRQPTRAASWSGARIRPRRRRISTSTGWPKRPPRSSSSIRSRRRRRLRPTCICNRSPGSDAALAFALAHVLHRDGHARSRPSSKPTPWASTSSSHCSRPARRSGGRRPRASRQRRSSTPRGCTRSARRSSGSARASSVSREAETHCGPWRCCRP